jgi:hypothetical protein
MFRWAYGLILIKKVQFELVCTEKTLRERCFFLFEAFYLFLRKIKNYIQTKFFNFEKNFKKQL